jgi:hypothetical protein
MEPARALCSKHTKCLADIKLHPLPHTLVCHFPDLAGITSDPSALRPGAKHSRPWVLEKRWAELVASAVLAVGPCVLHVTPLNLS